MVEMFDDRNGTVFGAINKETAERLRKIINDPKTGGYVLTNEGMKMVKGKYVKSG